MESPREKMSRLANEGNSSWGDKHYAPIESPYEKLRRLSNEGNSGDRRG